MPAAVQAFSFSPHPPRNIIIHNHNILAIVTRSFNALPAPEKVENQGQQQAQQQAGDEWKIKGKISPPYKDVARQPAQGRNPAKQVKQSPSQQQEDAEQHQHLCDTRKVIHAL